MHMMRRLPHACKRKKATVYLSALLFFQIISVSIQSANSSKRGRGASERERERETVREREQQTRVRDRERLNASILYGGGKWKENGSLRM